MCKSAFGTSLFSSFNRRLIATLMVLACNVGLAQAGALMTPTGLVTGDQFRVIFVTPGTTDATSADIATYDAFVTAQASGATYNGVLVNWRAVGSTSTVNAIDHIGTAAISGVYLNDGITKVASSTDNATDGLWSSSGGLLAQPTKDLSGQSYSGVFVWTGTNGIGTVYNTVAGGNFGLGSTSNGNGYFPEVRTEVGIVPGTTIHNWVEAGGITGVHPTTNTYQMYGISEVLTVVPEPSSLLSSGLGILVVALGRYSRKQKFVK